MIKIDSNTKDGTLNTSIIVSGKGGELIDELTCLVVQILKDMAQQAGKPTSSLYKSFVHRFGMITIPEMVAALVHEEEKSNDSAGNSAK